MSWCSDAPEDEAISLFAGLLANPDVRLSLKLMFADSRRTEQLSLFSQQTTHSGYC